MIIESSDVYAAIRAGIPYAVAVLATYLAIYCISYALLFKLLRLPWWSAFIPFYGQSLFFKKCGKSPWLVLLPFIPIIGLLYFVERLGLRMRLARAFQVFCLLRPLVWFLPIVSNIILYVRWWNKIVDIHEKCQLGETEKQDKKS